MMTPLVRPPLSGAPRKPRGNRSSARRLGPVRPYPVFIAYASIPAARAAMARIAQLLENEKENYQLQPMLWRFDQLDDARWREMALRDAARAATLVLALGDNPNLDARGETWLKTLAARERGAQLTAVAFIGHDEAWTISLQQTRAASNSAVRVTTPAAPAVDWQASPTIVTLGEKAAACAA